MEVPDPRRFGSRWGLDEMLYGCMPARSVFDMVAAVVGKQVAAGVQGAISWNQAHVLGVRAILLLWTVSG